MSFHKILCPIDFSPGSQQAMRLAMRMANDADAELVLMHSWYIPPLAFAGDFMLPPEYYEEIQVGAQTALDDAVEELTALGAKRLTSRLMTGVPWAAIMAVLEDAAFDLVVIGTRGRTGLSRILLGSVAEKVVRHAPCSVLAVHPDGESKAFSNILVPVDFSESSRHATELAAAIAVPGGAGITLFHVVDIPVAYSGEPAIPGFIRDLDKRSNDLLESWATQLRSKTAVPVVTRSRIGRPGAQTLAVLENEPAIDLVAVGTHGRTGVSRVLLGSVAEKIVRHAPCPVLVARKRT